MRSLLDINLIIALLDSAHVFHGSAQTWLEKEIQNGWATCPITENGVIRIMSQNAYPNSQPPSKIAERLAEACQHPTHEFWPETISLVKDGVIRWQYLLGPRQITDAYLLAIAVVNQGKFVSFDQHINLSVVYGATPANLQVVQPS